MLGDVGVGGSHPIRIQSMTNTDTLDTLATVDQVERLARAGCEIARVTAPSIRDAENLRNIKEQMKLRGIRIPLVADIHFTPNAAMIAAEHVEKIRINPGNFADKKKFEAREYTDSEYATEIERVADRFRPLVRRCRENGVAMRIGTNHGSLSDRIMNRFGDSPLGMVESALEFLDVCEAENYLDVIFSMKASNTQVAIQAYRLLAARLSERDCAGASYPFHLGVTEAGDSEDGRIKSAIGIGSLLEDGIGDTIRVSLTEDPVSEVPVAMHLSRRSEKRWQEDLTRSIPSEKLDLPMDPYTYSRRKSRSSEVGGLLFGGEEPIRVELEVPDPGMGPRARAEALAAALAEVADVACESFRVPVHDEGEWADFPLLAASLSTLGLALPLSVEMPVALLDRGLAVPQPAARLIARLTARDGFAALETAVEAAEVAGVPLEWCLAAELEELPSLIERALRACAEREASTLAFSLESARSLQGIRLLAATLGALGVEPPPIVLRYGARPSGDLESDLIEASIDLGAPLCDGLGDMVSLVGFQKADLALDFAYRILQGARCRTTRTEYISCPSCGRTQFDLEQTSARIKAATTDLKGVKIAIMGCIVNGPGEMADADFGYVGSGPGVVTLYVGQQIVARNIAEAEAPERLLDLIHGRTDSGPR